MKILTNCQKVMSLKNEYFQSRSFAVLVESHLAECPACLDLFIETALATPPPIIPPEIFAIPFSSHLDGTPAKTARRFGIITVSATLGVVGACLASQVLGDIPTPVHAVMASGEILLAGVILIEFGALFLLHEIARTDR
jgi:hypothetical protein